MTAQEHITRLAAVDLPAAVAEQERIHRWRAAREREDGLVLGIHRAKIAEALRIGDRLRRDRALGRIACSIRVRAWSLSLSDAAIGLARAIEEAIRYGGAALDGLRSAAMIEDTTHNRR